MSKITFTSFMSHANSAKAQHGTAFQKRLISLLSDEESAGTITSFVCNYRIGRPNCSNDQFYAPFMVQFGDGERWLLYSTTSLRDRIKGTQWDASNIKDIDSHVTKAYLVYPSDAKPREKSAFESKNSRYQSGQEFSAIDELMDKRRLLELLHDKANRDYQVLYPAGVLAKSLASGKYYDFVGRAFERDVAEVLANGDYLAAYKCGKSLPERKFQHFVTLMNSFGINPSTIERIRATANRCDIGDLPSGGMPKTDVIMLATLVDGTETMKTFSCKRVTGKEVSAHQYKADDFARILAPNDEQLRLHLNYFQIAGNFRNMPDGAVERLGVLIHPYVERLCRWVVSGEGGGGEERQIAQYVVTYRPYDNAFAVHSADEYVQWLMSECSRKTGGTPFSWTYQGKRGTNIQLKMPVML